MVSLYRSYNSTVQMTEPFSEQRNLDLGARASVKHTVIMSKCKSIVINRYLESCY